MGKIRKILENELVGGIESTDIYPITSTLAVYGPDNLRLDKHLENRENETLQKVDDKLDIQAIEFEDKATQEFEKNKDYVDNKSIEIIPQSVTPETLSQATLDLIEAGGSGSISNFPDDEDIESVTESNGVQVLKFKDREFLSSNYSGKGYKILRKNITSGGTNILTQDMLSDPNTVYLVRYDFDLQGVSLTMPINSILSFAGGCISNGSIVFNNGTIQSRDSQPIFREVYIAGSLTNEYLNLKWFDCIEYGRIINCITEITNCFIPCGSYPISIAIEIGDNRRVWGEIGSTLYTTGVFSLINLSYSENSTIDSLNLKGLQVGYPESMQQESSQYAIVGDGCKNILVRNCHMETFAGGALFKNNTENITIESCTFTDMKYIVYELNEDGSVKDGAGGYGCVFHFDDSYGVDDWSTYNSTIKNCTFNDVFRHVAYLQKCNGFMFTGNKIFSDKTDPVSYPTYFEMAINNASSKKVSITNNVMVGGLGFYQETLRHDTNIENVVLQCNMLSGQSPKRMNTAILAFRGSGPYVISNNTVTDGVYGPNSFGIQFQECSRGAIISNNTFNATSDSDTSVFMSIESYSESGSNNFNIKGNTFNVSSYAVSLSGVATNHTAIQSNIFNNINARALLLKNSLSYLSIIGNIFSNRYFVLSSIEEVSNVIISANIPAIGDDFAALGPDVALYQGASADTTANSALGGLKIFSARNGSPNIEEGSFYENGSIFLSSNFSENFPLLHVVKVAGDSPIIKKFHVNAFGADETGLDLGADETGTSYYNTVSKAYSVWNGSSWESYIKEAPEDGEVYGRKNGEWVSL